MSNKFVVESAFILTMNMENTVVKFLNERWSEEYRIVINVLMDKLEEGEITVQEYQDISVYWRLTELTERLEEEIFYSMKSMDRDESAVVPDLYEDGVLEYKKIEKANESQDAVIYGEVESVRCPEFVIADAKGRLCQTEVQLYNDGDDVPDVKTAKMIWTMGKIATGSVFDGGGGDLVLDRDMLKRGLISGW